MWSPVASFASKRLPEHCQSQHGELIPGDLRRLPSAELATIDMWLIENIRALSSMPIRRAPSQHTAFLVLGVGYSYYTFWYRL